MVYLFLADGFETIEALTVVDMLRRADIEIATVSINETKKVVSAHRIEVKADLLISEVDIENADMLVLPGGMPGTTNLRANEKLMTMVKKQYDANKFIAAICAAPAVILDDLGMLTGRKATCYPSYDEQLKQNGVNHTTAGAVRDENIITSRGMGCAIAFSSEIISALKDEKTAKMIEKAIVY